MAWADQGAGEFAGKVAFVSGGGNGIGRAMAELLAERGACVCVSDIDGRASAQAAEAIVAAGGLAIGLCGDIADKLAAKAMVDRAVAHFGRLDIAFNNAGIVDPGDEAWDDAAFQRSLDVNLSGMFHCMKAQLAHMVPAGRGAIVNTASIAALIASVAPNQPGYCASKHAVMGLTKVAALRHARAGIRVNAVLPGVTGTNMVREVMAQNPQARATLENMTPMGRIAEPREIAEAALFLASDRASFITGHGLVVDGGVIVQ